MIDAAAADSMPNTSSYGYVAIAEKGGTMPTMPPGLAPPPGLGATPSHATPLPDAEHVGVDSVDALLASFEMNDQICEQARSGSARRASLMLSEMVNLNGSSTDLLGDAVEPDLAAYTSVILSQAKAPDGSACTAQEILETIVQSDNPEIHANPVVVNAVLDAHAKCQDGSASVAYKLLHDMREVVCLDTISYNTAINCFAKCSAGQGGSAKGSLQVFADMREHGIAPNAVTYYSLLDAQARQQDGSAATALRVLDDMVRTIGVQPDLPMYTTCIKLQARAADGSARAALALLGRMRKSGVSPNAVTLNSVIDAQAKQRDGSGKVALSILDAMKKSQLEDVRPTVVTYTSAIDCQAKCGDGDGRTAVALLEEMHTEGLAPNNVTFGCCMNAQAKRGSAKVASDLLRKMLAGGLTPSHAQFNAVIDAHAKCQDGSAAEALRVFERMVQSGAKPNVVSYSTCIDAQAKRTDGSAATAAKLLEHLLAQNIQPDIVTFAGVIDAQAKRQDGSAATAVAILNRMSAYATPNQIHFNSTLNACANQRPSAVDLAEQVLAKMLAQDFTPTQYTMSALLRCAGFSSPARPDLARHWFLTFCRDGTVTVNDHVARALRNALPDMADDLLAGVSGTSAPLTSRRSMTRVINATARRPPLSAAWA